MKKKKPENDKLQMLYRTFDAFEINESPADLQIGPAQILLFKLTSLNLMSMNLHGYGLREMMLIAGNGGEIVVPSYASLIIPRNPMRPLEILRDSFRVLTGERGKNEESVKW